VCRYGTTSHARCDDKQRTHRPGRALQQLIAGIGTEARTRRRTTRVSKTDRITYLIEKRWGSFLLKRSRGGSGVFSTPLSPSFFHSEPLFLKLRWKRTLSWRTWKDSRLLSERWCTGWLSTLVLKGETGWFEGGGLGGQPLFSPFSLLSSRLFGQGHHSSVSICSSVWKTLAILFSGDSPPFKPLLRRFLRRSSLGRDENKIQAALGRRVS
jgi:hypothetical protein